MAKPTQQLTCPFCQAAITLVSPPTSNGGELFVAEDNDGDIECYDREAHPYRCSCTTRTIYIGE